MPQGDRFYAVGRDITREREREEALRQAQKMEAVGRLTGGIAHDFNNLLQAVQGNLELIARSPGDPDRVRRLAGNAAQAAERGARLTAQLLAFSRAQRLELRPVALAPLLNGMEDLLQRTLGPEVRVHVDAGRDEQAVLADPTQLEMAILNLAINARDAMAGGGDLTVSARPVSVDNDPELEPGGYVELAVADSGSGMSPDLAARAFDPFFTTKGVGKGTGLGLSQVYGMARQAGGIARIVSAPGEGTTVSILLPVAQAPMAVPAAGSAGEAAPAAQPAARARVMIVDDDPDVRSVLIDMVRQSGYAVVEAENGPDALALLDEAAPDLLLADFAMPGMNGAELADAVRARRPDLPIVFASGHSDTAAIDAAVGPGAFVLRKPFQAQQLEAIIAAALAAG